MFKLFSCAFYISCILISFNSNSANTYYKCVTEKGTIFSQFPCDNNATVYKINTTTNQQCGPKVDYTKQLNELERERLLNDLHAELRSNNYKLSILDREKERAEYKQQQRLNHILANDDKKRITRDITKKLKVINKEYKKDVSAITARIKKLEKKIKSYQ
ncbi:hypothetical protein P20652_2773 [Pseudoalteromonas sp. BSi20652]|uniref:hypothetical protein n=1 Tax=Pseudoalteromonas sp. BSi20652 TaxID=388384 RepID=UPI000231BABC|nr:hypothetical protein [Pseudoalteromonas sp. BSi20652]GAA60905.1 hypothetical protein P20652_2773 [Pseudoalteromonas sp. BSi20652]